MADFQAIQHEFSNHLRNPSGSVAPAGIEDRRLGIYRDLVYNNIEGFIAGGFPVLREILDDERWHSLVREFVHKHRSISPYFLEISQEFLSFLQNEFVSGEHYPDFILELAHYEWVELALDVAQGDLPDRDPTLSLMEAPVQVSPLLWCLSYRYPVHTLGPDYQPESAPDVPTFLLVYRNRADTVEFMLSNAITIRLIKIIQDGQSSGHTALRQLAAEMQHPDTAQLLCYGESLLNQLCQRDILWPFLPDL
ncbi:putative DNA-binding domain-containing protein [Gilvimarinus sp. SDUM040013]|uniref:DNA-binding domain-containing protein n=1 Tax=Gilvimarinus gilvus TaxID=3058038 RepID=A0ABU4RWT6_9GAMM|nr:putative DNA-binding domain-containing protein [Gilvimarinus sp. SDUM040013]MDO3386958.1 putative DNA-binding domain-containing protein [Gilvimarinus sp. SDUM040013]MDX6848148.1 putative DNA-binding domain-containing protein [Gilvimarinus sp. SDUM040013]